MHSRRQIPEEKAECGPPAIIPIPQSMIEQSGATMLDAKTKLIYDSQDIELTQAVRFFQNWIDAQKLKSTDGRDNSRMIVTIDSNLAPQAYSLTADPNEITIKGGNSAGVFYAMQTFISLTQP